MLKQSLCQLLSPSPQHLLGWAASLLKQDQGAQTLPLSCLVCDEASGSLLRIGRKTHADWTF